MFFSCLTNGLPSVLSCDHSILMPFFVLSYQVKSEYVHHKAISGAIGVKLCATGIEKAVAGTPIMVVGPEDDEEDIKEEVTIVYIESGVTCVCVCSPSPASRLPSPLVFWHPSCAIWFRLELCVASFFLPLVRPFFLGLLDRCSVQFFLINHGAIYIPRLRHVIVCPLPLSPNASPLLAVPYHVYIHHICSSFIIIHICSSWIVACIPPPLSLSLPGWTD